MNTLNLISLFGKTISEPNRLRLLMLVKNNEVCVCHLISILKLSPSTISQHLSVLKKNGLITARKEGTWIYYMAAFDQELIKPLFDYIQSYLNLDSVIQDDYQKLQDLLKGEIICKTPLKKES